jgi:hypothetical protein
MHQQYEVPFLINHAMSHIHYYENIELRGPGLQSLNKVLTKYLEISNVLFQCANSILAHG